MKIKHVLIQRRNWHIFTYGPFSLGLDFFINRDCISLNIGVIFAINISIYRVDN